MGSQMRNFVTGMCLPLLMVQMADGAPWTPGAPKGLAPIGCLMMVPGDLSLRTDQKEIGLVMAATEAQNNEVGEKENLKNQEATQEEEEEAEDKEKEMDGKNATMVAKAAAQANEGQFEKGDSVISTCEIQDEFGQKIRKGEEGKVLGVEDDPNAVGRKLVKVLFGSVGMKVQLTEIKHKELDQGWPSNKEFAALAAKVEAGDKASAALAATVEEQALTIGVLKKVSTRLANNIDLLNEKTDVLHDGVAKALTVLDRKVSEKTLQ